MPSVPVKEVTIRFGSLEAISRYKLACGCNDFYVDREAVSLVGFFSEEQIQLAVESFGAVLKVKPW